MRQASPHDVAARRPRRQNSAFAQMTGARRVRPNADGPARVHPRRESVVVHVAIDGIAWRPYRLSLAVRADRSADGEAFDRKVIRVWSSSGRSSARL